MLGIFSEYMQDLKSMRDENITYQEGFKYGRYMRLEVWEKFAGLGGNLILEIA